jgi:hypothetical protein
MMYLALSYDHRVVDGKEASLPRPRERTASSSPPAVAGAVENAAFATTPDVFKWAPSLDNRRLG